MLTIIFYTTNGPAAKLRSREIAATKGHYARIYDAAVWEGRNRDQCDVVEIMPDVPQWQVDRIMAIYGDKAVSLEELQPIEVEQEPSIQKQMGLMPPKEQMSEAAEKKAVHKGGGRWFVMVGEERISGPHDKLEAQRLAELQEEAA